MTARLATLLTLCLTACATSPSPKNYSRANSVRGVIGSLVLQDGRSLTGELLAINDSAFVLLQNERIGFVRFGAVRSFHFAEGGSPTLLLEPATWPKTIGRARLLSRFPYGITAPAMMELLAASKQEAPDDLTRRPSSSDSVERFIGDARESTRRYESQDAAVADGFKRVGVEFPTMGEHWISIARIAENTFAAGRPALLIYVNIDGVARLAGVGYTALVTGRQPPPAFPSVGAWHEHSGGVADESLPGGHHAMMRAPSAVPDDDASPRLFVMHAWVWSANPDGVFATNNWSFPLVRLGVPLSESTSPAALRALALATDDNDYHLLVLRTAVMLSPSEEQAAGQLLETYHQRASREAALIRAAGHLTPDGSQRLAEIWDSLWTDLERTLPARTDRLRALRREL